MTFLEQNNSKHFSYVTVFFLYTTKYPHGWIHHSNVIHCSPVLPYKVSRTRNGLTVSNSSWMRLILGTTRGWGLTNEGKENCLLQVQEWRSTSFRMKLLSSTRTQTSTMRSCLQLKCCESIKCGLLKKYKASQTCDRLKTKHKTKKRGYFLNIIWSRESRGKV